MGHIDGAPCTQQMLWPEALDDDVAEENPARCIDAFMDSRALEALGVRHTPPAATGRPAYAPGDLRTLDIDGSMNRLRCRRRLARDTPRNVERLWLLRTRHPDVTTLADVRQEKAHACTQVVRACARLGNEWGRWGQARVAIDGTTRKAVQSKRRHVTPAQLHEMLKRLDAHLEPYVHDLDAADAEETARQQTTAAQWREQIRELRARQGRYAGLRRELAIRGQRQVSVTDPDSRALPKRPTGDVGDHAHVAVDATQTRWVIHEGPQAVTDLHQRSGIARQAQEAWAGAQVNVVADRGSSHGEAINACEEAGIDPDGAKPWTSAHRHVGL